MAVFEFEVCHVDGYCPMYKVGDKMVVDGNRIVMKQNKDLCNYALLSLKKKAASLVDVECDKEHQVKCMEKCAEYSTGGFVVFSCKRLEEAMF